MSRKLPTRKPPRHTYGPVPPEKLTEYNSDSEEISFIKETTVQEAEQSRYRPYMSDDDDVRSYGTSTHSPTTRSANRFASKLKNQVYGAYRAVRNVSLDLGIITDEEGDTDEAPGDVVVTTLLFLTVYALATEGFFAAFLQAVPLVLLSPSFGRPIVERLPVYSKEPVHAPIRILLSALALAQLAALRHGWSVGSIVAGLQVLLFVPRLLVWMTGGDAAPRGWKAKSWALFRLGLFMFGLVGGVKWSVLLKDAMWLETNNELVKRVGYGGEGVERVEERVRQRGRDATSYVRNKSSDARGYVDAKSRDAGGYVRDKSRDASSKVKKGYRDAKDKVGKWDQKSKTSSHRGNSSPLSRISLPSTSDIRSSLPSPHAPSPATVFKVLGFPITLLWTILTNVVKAQLGLLLLYTLYQLFFHSQPWQSEYIATHGLFPGIWKWITDVWPWDFMTVGMYRLGTQKLREVGMWVTSMKHDLKNAGMDEMREGLRRAGFGYHVNTWSAARLKEEWTKLTMHSFWGKVGQLRDADLPVPSPLPFEPSSEEIAQTKFLKNLGWRRDETGLHFWPQDSWLSLGWTGGVTSFWTPPIVYILYRRVWLPFARRAGR